MVFLSPLCGLGYPIPPIGGCASCVLPDDVSCPDDVEAEVGVTFECDFTGPDGDYVAEVEIVEVSGDEAQFRVVTKLDR